MSLSTLSDDFPLTMEVEIDPNSGAPRVNCPPVGVAFGLEPIVDKKASKEAGRDVYKDVEFVKIAIPGDRNSLYFQPADDRVRARFPRAFEAFKRRDATPIQGTPIEQWAAVSRSLALTLRAAHIPTVEALAAVHDGLVDKLGAQGRELRGKAIAWLAQAAGGAATMALASEKKQLQDQIAAMQAQIMALSASASPEQKAAMAKAAATPVIAAPDTTANVEQDVAAAARRPRVRKAA